MDTNPSTEKYESLILPYLGAEIDMFLGSVIGFPFSLRGSVKRNRIYEG